MTAFQSKTVGVGSWVKTWYEYSMLPESDSAEKLMIWEAKDCCWERPQVRSRA